MSNHCLFQIKDSPKHRSITLCLTNRETEKCCRRTNERRGWTGEDGGSKTEWWGEGGSVERIQGREMEVVCGDTGRKLERKFERNVATHVSKQPQTSALCKNNLSNYEKPLPAFLPEMLHCTAHLSPPLSPLIYISCVHLDAAI